MNPEGHFSIGKAEEATGIKVVTIRYYEHIGLVPKPSRTAGNYRAYGPEHLRRLLFIRRCRELGFTLWQVRDLLRLSAKDDGACAEVDRIAAEHLKRINRKIEDLKRLAGELNRMKKRCPGKGRIADCRILEALSPGFSAFRDASPQGSRVPSQSRIP